jgi:hypothetical protein
MDEILDEFKSESKGLIEEMLGILEEVEDDPSKLARLEDYGLLADRIMGTAKSLSVQGVGSAEIDRIGTYGELCKLVGYKGAQLVAKPQLASVVVALLLDATEMLDQMNDALDTTSALNINSLLSDTFLDRLRWVSRQFDADLRGTVAVSGAQLAQDQIDAILKKIGIAGR